MSGKVLVNAAEFVAELIERAKKAQGIAEAFSQEKVDELVTATSFGGVEVIKRKRGTFYSVAPFIISVHRPLIYDQNSMLPQSYMTDA